MLIRLGRPAWFTAIPLAFLLTMTLWALQGQIMRFYNTSNWLLFTMSILILVAALWVAVEAIIAMGRGRKGAPVASTSH